MSFKIHLYITLLLFVVFCTKASNAPAPILYNSIDSTDVIDFQLNVSGYRSLKFQPSFFSKRNDTIFYVYVYYNSIDSTTIDSTVIQNIYLPCDNRRKWWMTQYENGDIRICKFKKTRRHSEDFVKADNSGVWGTEMEMRDFDLYDKDMQLIEWCRFYLFGISYSEVCVHPKSAVKDVTIKMDTDFRDKDKVIWRINGTDFRYENFPVTIHGNPQTIDTIVCIKKYSDKYKYDTVFTRFPHNAELQLVHADNDAMFDIICEKREDPSISRKNEGVFSVTNDIGDTIVCCYASAVTSTGQIFVNSGESGWLKPFTNIYSTHIIRVDICKAKGMPYETLPQNDAVLFGDEHCTIAYLDMEKLIKLHSFGLRLFGNEKAFITYNHNTNTTDITIIDCE